MHIHSPPHAHNPTGSYFNGASRPVKIPNSSNSNNNSNNLFSNNSLSNSFLGSSIGHKDSMDNYPYGRSYPLLAPIGSEHAASIFYDKVGCLISDFIGVLVTFFPRVLLTFSAVKSLNF